MSVYDALLDAPKPKASPYDALLATPKASPYDALLPKQPEDLSKGNADFWKDGTQPSQATINNDIQDSSGQTQQERERTQLGLENQRSGLDKSAEAYTAATLNTSLLAGIEPSNEFEQNNPKTATVLKHIAEPFKIGTVFPMLATAEVASVAIPAKLMALGFSAYSAKNTAESVINAYKTDDPTERAGFITDAVVNGIFGTLAGYGGLKTKKGLSPEEVTAHLDKLSPDILQAGIELSKDPKFKKLLPYDQKLIQEALERKGVPTVVLEKTPNETQPTETTQATTEPPVAENTQLAEKPAEQAGVAGSEVGKQAVAPEGKTVPEPQVDNPSMPHIVASAIETPEGIKVGSEVNTPHEGIGAFHGMDEVAQEQRGFLVDDGKGNQRFVGREEAGVIADSSGQRTPETVGNPLQSQDLKPSETAGVPADIGVGAANPSDFPEPKRTSTKNAIVDEERAKRGELPMMQPAKQALGEVWQKAMETIDRDPEAGNKLVQELREKPRTINATEEALLLHQKIDNSNDLERETERALDPQSTPEERAEASVRASSLLDRANEIDQATKTAGTEWGRTGRFRQQLALSDYSLAKMLQRKQLANEGKPLTVEQTAEITKLSKRIQELEKQLADHESKQEKVRDKSKDDQADKNIEKMRQSKSKEYSEEELTAKIKDNAKNPESTGSWIQKLAEHFVRQGVIERNALVDAVHGAIKDILPDATKRDIRDAISGYGKYSELSKDQVKVTLRDLKGQMQQVSKLEDMLEKGELPAKTGVERRIPTAEERSLIKEVNKVRKELGLESDDPTKLKSAKEAIKTRLQNRIEDLQRAIEKNEKLPKKSRKTVDDEEITQLRKDKDSVQAEYDSVFKEPKLTPEQIALKVYKTRTTKRIADLQDRITRGDYSKKERVPLKLDAEAINLKDEASRLKEKFDQGVTKDKLRSRTPLQKTLDTFTKWRRGFILSGPVTLAKLTSAALQRITVTPLEELFGAGLSKLPGLDRVAELAPREGGLNVKAEAKAFTEGFSKGMKDAWDVLRTGKSDLDTLYGKKDVMPRTAIDFIGSIHGALKTVAKRNEFTRSLEKRATQALAEGVDITDPMVQTRLALDAYKDANKAIFMQDNRVVSAYKRALSAFENPDKNGKLPASSKIAATTARVLLPIVKVPTNIVAETFEYALGSVTGSVRLAKALRNGVEKLKPEEADQIMRNLKKGSLGAAVLLLGYYNSENIGGYYQGKKQKDGDVSFGGVKVFGKEIPKYLVHNPLLEMLQLGATVRKVSDSYFRKKDTEKQGLGAGIAAAGLGLTEEVPFVKEMMEITKAYNPDERGAFFGELAKSLLVPQLIQTIANSRDKTKRDPQTILQHIETGIPGLKEKVPAKDSGKIKYSK